MSHTATCDRSEHVHEGVEAPEHDHSQGNSHGIVDSAITRSNAGIRAVSISLAVLTVTAVAQTLIYALTLSVALLADLIHNFGDASTAIRSASRSSSAARAANGSPGSRSCSRSSSAPVSRSSRRSYASSTRTPSPTSGGSPPRA
jgi:uncharacterized low-complexity protein